MTSARPSASNAAAVAELAQSDQTPSRLLPPHAALQPAAAMPRGRRLTQIDGVLLSGGCHACRMRASNSRAKYAHHCGRERRTCTLRQFYHGCSVALGISTEPMSVQTPLTREERLAKRGALNAWEDYAEVMFGVVAPPAPPQRKVGAPCSDSDSEPDDSRSEPDEAGRQHGTVPEDVEGEPPPPTEGDESEEDIEAQPTAPAPPPVEQPRSLLTGRFGARDTMDPQLLGSLYRVV